MNQNSEQSKKRPDEPAEALELESNQPALAGADSVAPISQAVFDTHAGAFGAIKPPGPWRGTGRPPIAAPGVAKLPWDNINPYSPAPQAPAPAEKFDQDKALLAMEAHRDAERASLEREKIRRGMAVEDGYGYQPPRELLGRDLNTVRMKAIEWLWTGWIPKGYVTIWAGETGAGKSTVLAYVTATITTGASWPGEQVARQPSRVLWLGSEDGTEELTIPRLVACGADLTRVTEIQGVRQAGQRSSFSMQDDLQAVSSWLSHAQQLGHPFGMLVIDPVTSYLPGRKLKRVDLNDAGQLRSVLEPWLALAQQHDLAIVCVTHFMKDTTRSMLHRVLGSAAFAQTCRSLCAVVARPDEGAYSKALIQVKVNLPEHPGGAWKFRTERVQVGVDGRNGKPIFATRPMWEELDKDLTPESLVGGERGPVSKYPAAFGMWLRMHFLNVPRDQGQKSADVKAAAIAAGVVTARWWDDHSNEYLDKQNVGGDWWCRPKAQ